MSRQRQHLWLEVVPLLGCLANVAHELLLCLKAFQANLVGDRVGLLQLRARERIHDLVVPAACAWMDGLGCLEVSLPSLADYGFCADNAGGLSICPRQFPLCIREVADVTLHLALGAYCRW